MNCCFQCYPMSAPSAIKMQLALHTADKVALSFPELEEDTIRVLFRTETIIDKRKTNAAAFAAAATLLGVIE